MNERENDDDDTTLPSPTGKEVSDEAKAAGEAEASNHIRRFQGQENVPEIGYHVQALLSTARAQDKAALVELEIQRFGKDAQCRQYRCDNDKLKEEVARLKAEVKTSNSQQDFALATAADLRTRLAQAEKERDEERANYQRLRGAVNGSDPVDLEYIRALEKDKLVIEAARDIAEQQSDVYKNRVAELTKGSKAMEDSLGSAEQKLKEANERLFRAGDEPLAILGVAEQRVRELEASILPTAAALADLRTRLENERQRNVAFCNKVVETRQELEAIRTASSCPTGTDLAAWVGQLAEDKRRVDTIITSFAKIEVWDGEHWKVVKLNSRSAIDASNPKTE